MNQLSREGAEHAAEYLGAMQGTWPLASVAWCVALASALRQLRRGYRQRTAGEKAATAFLNATVTASMAVGFAMLLPWAFPEVTPETQVAGAMVLSGLGGEALRLWTLRKLGLSVVDLMNPDDINEIRLSMSPETRRRHAAQCPFRGEECSEAERQRPEAERGE